ncbi:MAG: hypothetical protein D6B28_10835 [Gammaproteobacteria bacterium]|nr:MAG: hypothetical protein D6B28_10835 [Gammaproteobacteria bacterium]
MKTTIKRIFFLFLLLLIIIGIVYGYLYRINNKSAPLPSYTEFVESRDAAKSWIIANKDEILTDPNPMLWWMIKQSTLITKDEDLEKIYQAYTTNFHNTFPTSAWNKLIHPKRYFRINIDEVLQYPDYNQHIIYGLTCDNELAELDIIKEQNKASFCGTYHPISPACVTHQMMGIFFAQENNCLPKQEATQLMSYLQNKAIKQLEYDPRVVDVYLQRVLMLLLTNSKDNIQPIWIKRIIDAQLSDGGWGDFDDLINIGNYNELGFTKKSIGIRKPKSDFHATAQGLLIFSILANKQ